MYRARVVFNGPLNKEYVFYSVTKESEGEIRSMLHEMTAYILVHAVSVRVQSNTAHDGSWVTLPVFNDDWTQRGLNHHDRT